MKIRLYSLILMVLVVSLSSSYASLTPVGSYDLTFARNGWSTTQTIPVTDFPTATPFYQVGGQDVNVYLQEVPCDVPNVCSFTWYVNAPAVLADPDNNEFLGGTGPLTITVSGLKFVETNDVMFQPSITHIYYVGFVNGAFTPMHIPGEEAVSPGESQYQRSSIEPLTPADYDYTAFGESYGTPYEVTSSPDVTFVLPDMYVPNGEIWELSFGAGFMPNPNVPEPASLLILGLGLLGFKRK
jgi:hypothetical protein